LGAAATRAAWRDVYIGWIVLVVIVFALVVL